MAFSFDESEYDTGSEAQEVAVTQAIQSNMPPQPTSTDIEEEQDDSAYMSDVDTRLEVASYYRALLNSGIFSEDTEAANIIEREIRTFVKGRLGILLAMPSASIPTVTKRETMPADSLTEEEIKALKIVAATLIKKPALMDKVAPKAPEIKSKPAPSVVKVQVPVTKPAVMKVKEAPPRPVSAPQKQVNKPGPKPKKTAPAIEEVRLIPHPSDPSVMVESKHQRINKVPGAVPMPATNQAMAAILSSKATEAAGVAIGSNPLNAGIINRVM